MALAMESLSHAADKMQQLVDTLNSLNMHSLDQTPRDECARPSWPEISVLGADTWTEKTFKNETPDTIDKTATAATWTTASTSYDTMTGFNANDSLDLSFVGSFSGDLHHADSFRRRIRGRLVTSIGECQLPSMLQETLSVHAPDPRSDDDRLKEVESSGIEQSQMQPLRETVVSHPSAVVTYDDVSLPREWQHTEQAEYVPGAPAAQIKFSKTDLPKSQAGQARRKVSFCSVSSQNSAAAGIGEALGCAANSMQQLLKALKEALADSPEPSPRIMPPVAANRHEAHLPADLVELQAKKQEQQRQLSDRLHLAGQADWQQPLDRAEHKLNVTELHIQERKEGHWRAEVPSHEIRAQRQASGTDQILRCGQQAEAVNSIVSQARDTDVPHHHLRSKFPESSNGDTKPGELSAVLADSGEEKFTQAPSTLEEAPQSNQHTAEISSKIPLHHTHQTITPESKALKDADSDSLRRRLRSKMIASIKENCPVNVLWSDESPRQVPRQQAGIEMLKPTFGETDALRRRLRSNFIHAIKQSDMRSLLPVGACKSDPQQQTASESRTSEKCDNDSVRVKFHDSREAAHTSNHSGTLGSIRHSSAQHTVMQTSKGSDATCVQKHLHPTLINATDANNTAQLFPSDRTFSSESQDQGTVDQAVQQTPSDRTFRSESQHQGTVNQAVQQTPSERLSKVVTHVKSVGEDLQQLLGSVRSASASREQTPRTEVAASATMAVDSKQGTGHPELEEPWLVPLLQHRRNPETLPSPKVPETMLQGFELASKYLDDLLQLLARVDAEHLDDTPRDLVKPSTSDPDGNYTAPVEVFSALTDSAPPSGVATAHLVLSAGEATPASGGGHSCHSEVAPSPEIAIPVSVDASREGVSAAEQFFSKPERMTVAAAEGLRPGQESVRHRLRCGFLQALRFGSAEVALGRALASDAPAAPAEKHLEVHTLPMESFVSPEMVPAASTEAPKPSLGSLRQRLRHGFLQRLQDGSVESTMGQAFACEAHAASTEALPEVLAPATDSTVSLAEVPAASQEISRPGQENLRHRLCQGFLQQLQNNTLEDNLKLAFASDAAATPAETSWPGQASSRRRLRHGFLQRLQDGSAEVTIGRSFANDPAESTPEVLAEWTESLISSPEVPSPAMKASRPAKKALRHRLRDGFLQQLHDGSAEGAIARASAMEAPSAPAEPSPEEVAASAGSLVSPAKVPAVSAEASGSSEETMRHRLRHGFLLQIQDGKAESTIGQAFASEAPGKSAEPSPAVIATPTETLVSLAEEPTSSTESFGLRPIGQPMHDLKQRLRAGLRSAIQGDSLADMLQGDSLQETGSREANSLEVAGPPKKDASCEEARLKLRSGLLGALRTGRSTQLIQSTLDLPHPSVSVAAVMEADSKHNQFLQKTERFLHKLDALPSTTPSASSSQIKQKRLQQTPFAAAVSLAAARAAQRFKKHAELGGETGQEGDGRYKSQSVQPPASASSLLCRRALLTLAEAIWDGRLEAPLEGFGWISGDEAKKEENVAFPSSTSDDGDAWLDEIVANRLLSPGKTDDYCESEASTAVGTPRLSCMIPDIPSARSSNSTQEPDLTSMIPDPRSSIALPSTQPVDEDTDLPSSRFSETLQEADLASMIPYIPSSIASASTQAAEPGREPTPRLCQFMPAAGTWNAAAQEWKVPTSLSKPSLGARTVVWDGTKWIRTKSEPQLAPIPQAPLLQMQQAQLDVSPWERISKTPLATLPSMPAGGAHHAARWLAGTGDMNAEIGTQRAHRNQWMQRKWL